MKRSSYALGSYFVKWVGDGAFRADVEDVEGGEGGSGGKWRKTGVGNPVLDNTNR